MVNYKIKLLSKVVYAHPKSWTAPGLSLKYRFPIIQYYDNKATTKIRKISRINLQRSHMQQFMSPYQEHRTSKQANSPIQFINKQEFIYKPIMLRSLDALFLIKESELQAFCFNNTNGCLLTSCEEKTFQETHINQPQRRGTCTLPKSQHGQLRHISHDMINSMAANLYTKIVNHFIITKICTTGQLDDKTSSQVSTC